MKGGKKRTDNSYLIERLDVEGMKKAIKIGGDEMNFESKEQAIMYLKRVDMAMLLGLPKNHKCLFHNDKHASAGIFKTENGVYLYKCHSPDCALFKSDDIFGITKELAGVNFECAIRFWFDVFSITYGQKTKLILPNEKNARLEQNRRWLNDKKQSEAMKTIGKNIEILYALYEIAKEICVPIEDNGYVLVGASEREISKRLERVMKISRGLAILAYFGLIRRLPIYEIKDKRRQKLIEIRAKNKTARLISQTQIKLFDNENELEAQLNSALISWQEFGHKTRCFTFANVAKNQNIFKANELFPNK